jgi:hypothetical protein
MIEIIEELVESIEQAIKSGDWVVDGACDPMAGLVRAKKAIQMGGITYKARNAFWDVALGNNSKLANLAKLAIDEAEKNPPQRQWVGLTKKEVHDLYDSDYAVFHQRIEAKLKQKNGYAEEKNT